MRVHELGKELGHSSKEIIAKLHDLDIEAKSHMSTVDETAIELLREAYGEPAAASQPKPPAKAEPDSKPEPESKPEPKADAEAAPVEAAPTPAKDVDEVGEVEIDGKTVRIRGPVMVKDLAVALDIRPPLLIAELMKMNVLASINQRVDVNVARKVVEKHGFEFEYEKKLAEHRLSVQSKKTVEEKEDEDRPEDLVIRPPVVTFLGHVDHGKTSLLDRIRDTAVVKGESGGITQHIGASTVEVGGKKITFLDTPGHAAFTAMRARGANMTDIAVIIIAADDGIMPQTEEAISHVQAAGVTMMVAINKVDLPSANVDRVKQQLQAKEMTPEDWGGELICAPVSAETGEGVEHLLEMILLQAEIQELKANPDRRARGYVIESQLEPGMGPTANILVTQGTLKLGDVVLCEKHCGKVRALINDHGSKVKSAGPATPVKCLGLSGVPEAGAEFQVYANEKAAKAQAAELSRQERSEQLVSPQKASLDDLFSTIEAGEKLELKLIVKADTRGSVEAIVQSLEEIISDKISLDIILSAVGNISENDIMLASASNAVVVGFHVGKDPGVDNSAKHHGVDLRLHQIIYELIDQVRDAMTGMLAPELREHIRGHAEIRQVFPLGKVNRAAGCFVTDGTIGAKNRVRVKRADEILFEGKLESLRRFQDEVSEVREGLECGIRMAGFNGFAEGDILEFYEVEEREQTL